jgi:hypothetical protein
LNLLDRVGAVLQHVLLAYIVALVGTVLGDLVIRGAWSLTFGRLPAWTCYEVNGEFWKVIVLYLVMAPAVVAILFAGSRRSLLALAVTGGALVPFVWSFTRTTHCVGL